jgi:DNA-binding NarL/FixJ family response regulator
LEAPTDEKRLKPNSRSTSLGNSAMKIYNQAMQLYNQAMRAELSSRPIGERFDMSGSQVKKICVYIVDQRDFMGGCLSVWLDEAPGEFLTIMVSDITRAFEIEQPLDAAVAILSVPSLATGRVWLEKQVALIREHSADLPVVIIMDEDEDAYRPGLLASLRVQGYIPTSSSLDVALAALRLVIAGGRYFPHSGESTTRSKIHFDPTATGEPANLTRREWEVLELIANGLPNKIIAHRLNLALGTVKIHVHHIIDKLKVKNRTEAALWGQEFRNRREHRPDLVPPRDPEGLLC